jgi:hypothetical protein
MFVGHSVSAMIGMLADLKAPGTFAAHMMVGPSPCYINDGDYIGGFTREDIDSLLDTLESNYLGWASSMAPAIMGVPERPELGAGAHRQLLPHRPRHRQAVRQGHLPVGQPQGRGEAADAHAGDPVVRRPDRSRGRRRIHAAHAAQRHLAGGGRTPAIART